MPTNRKDIYSGMPESSFGGFGGVQRDEMVASPMRSQSARRRRRRRARPQEEKSIQRKSLWQQSFEKTFIKRLDEIDDEALDVLFPPDDDAAVDKFVDEIDDKWIFDTAGAFIRRALTGRRRRRRKWKSADARITTKVKTGPCWDGYEQVGMKKGKGGRMVPNCVPVEGKSLDKWFREGWVDLSRPKKGGGFEPCGRRDASTGKYPKCVPAAKAAKMTPEEIASAVRRKRRAESTRTRVDKKPINVSTYKKDARFGVEVKAAIPTDPELYARVKAQAKKKFDVYPSAYANAWLVREYKKRGGKYRTGKKTLGNDGLSYKSAKKPRLRDPKGGLTAAGRAHFKRTEGANLKPGVKGAADTPDKMRRKGSFLTRFFTNPSGPMVGENGKPTRLALSAAAWGEPVPKNRSDAAKLAAKGRRLLERYENTKKSKKK